MSVAENAPGMAVAVTQGAVVGLLSFSLALCWAVAKHAGPLFFRKFARAHRLTGLVCVSPDNGKGGRLGVGTVNEVQADGCSCMAVALVGPPDEVAAVASVLSWQTCSYSGAACTR